jgi:hypothetical protein
MPPELKDTKGCNARSKTVTIPLFKDAERVSFK